MAEATKFATKHISYRENRADNNFEWDVKFDLSFNGILFLTTVKVDLVGANPSAALVNTWDRGVSNIWNDQGFFTDGTWTYATRFDIQFVNAGAHQTVNVIAGNGRGSMNEWYTQFSWGAEYYDDNAAHEFGHMFGLFDEYAGGATYGNQLRDDGLMGPDFGRDGFERYYWTIDHFAQIHSAATLDFVKPKRGGDRADTFNGTANADALLGFGGNDVLRGGAKGDWLHGGDDNDRLGGDAGRDYLFGGGDNDTLSGGADGDRLAGQGGNDTLAGGLGIDELTGGADIDKFVFNTAISSATADLIKDFASNDFIYLSGKIFTKPEVAVDASEFRYGAAVDANDYFLYVKASGRLYYDADGVKTKFKPILFADLQNNAPLTYSDLKMFDAVASLDNLTISKSGGIEGFKGTYQARQDVDYNWTFDAYGIPNSLRIWDNTGNYVSFVNRSGFSSGQFELRDNSNGLVNISVAGSASGTQWNLSVKKAATAPLAPDFPVVGDAVEFAGQQHHDVWMI